MPVARRFRRVRPRARLLLAVGWLVVSPPGARVWSAPQTADAQQPSNAAAGAWLAAPLVNWNVAGAELPRSGQAATPPHEAMRRCQLRSPATAAAQKLSGLGWTPYLHLDRELVRGGIEVVGGLSGVTTECGPVGFNLFVFVGGRYAGTLSPVAMTHQTDGAAGAVRLLPEGVITAEFARYTPTDTPCCPSSRVTVRYHIEMGPGRPLVSPLEVRITR